MYCVSIIYKGAVLSMSSSAVVPLVEGRSRPMLVSGRVAAWLSRAAPENSIPKSGAQKVNGKCFHGETEGKGENKMAYIETIETNDYVDPHMWNNFPTR